MNEATEIGAQQQIVYQFERFVSLTGWWTWAAVVVGLAIVLVGIARLYRRDTLEVPRATGAAMVFLRLAAAIALIFFFLNFERRAQQRVTRPSETVVLVDTSQSMSLPATTEPTGQSRIEAVASLLKETPLLDSLASEHRVVVYGFDATSEIRELATFAAPETVAAQPEPSPSGSIDWTRLALVGAAVLAFGALGLVASGIAPLLQLRFAAGLVLASAISLVIGGAIIAIAWTVNTDRSLGQLLGFAPPRTPTTTTTSDPDAETETQEPKAWDSILVAAGNSSRIGDAVRGVLSRHDPSTLAGIMLMTDGQSNAGIPLADAGAFAAHEGVNVYPIGFGSPKPPVNVRIVDVDLPRRVYPGDKFALSVVLQASGLRGKQVDIEIVEGPDAETDPTEIIESRRVLLDEDGKLSGFQFDLTPPAIGSRKLAVRVRAPTADQHPEDNQREARYEVVARKVRVLLVAGGPMREYRFVRNLLYRDRDVAVDVLLQTGQRGMSQDADKVLEDFPTSAEELFAYDAIVGFDPDWMQLEAAQIQLLEQWLSDMSGGLILIAGPVHLPQWSRLRGDLRAKTIKGFFPVSLTGRGPLLDTGRQGGDTPWPLKFTADGQRSEYLSLTDLASESTEIWSDFSGVYDFVGVKEAKPGAKILATFSDPTATTDGRAPIYLASQFYGSGRVFFQGSGEMWRLRAVSDSYFETYYTKLVRWATEGRLLRDSTRGVLLVDKPRAMVGETINVRAVLTDAQYRPLELPRVIAELDSATGEKREIVLRPLEGQPRAGTYGGQFVAKTSGSFELQLLLGDALDEQVLRQPIQIRLPTLELERPQRGDTSLRAVAAATGGKFAEGSGSDPDDSDVTTPLNVVISIEPRPQTTVLPGTPDRDFHRRRNASLIWLVGGALALEWLLRRLNRLA